MPALLADYTALCAGFTNLESHLQALSNEPFAQKLSEVAGEAKAAHELIKTEFAAAQAAYESALSYFGEDVVSPEEFFGNIYRFHASFDQVVKEINRINQSAQRRGKQGGATTPPPSAERGQFLDNIITKIHDSKMFRNRTNISEVIVDSIPPHALFVNN